MGCRVERSPCASIALTQARLEKLSRQPHQVLHGNNRIEEIVRLDNRRQMAFVHQRSPHRPALVSAQTLDFLLNLVLDFAAYLALPFNFHDVHRTAGLYEKVYLQPCDARTAIGWSTIKVHLFAVFTIRCTFFSVKQGAPICRFHN